MGSLPLAQLYYLFCEHVQGDTESEGGGSGEMDGASLTNSQDPCPRTGMLTLLSQCCCMFSPLHVAVHVLSPSQVAELVAVLLLPGEDVGEAPLE